MTMILHASYCNYIYCLNHIIIIFIIYITKKKHIHTSTHINTISPSNPLQNVTKKLIYVHYVSSEMSIN